MSKPVKGTALVKSRERYKKLIAHFPERKEFYLEKIAEVEDDIVAAGVCRRCGRPLTDEHAKERGYGNECMKKKEAEDADKERPEDLA